MLARLLAVAGIWARRMMARARFTQSDVQKAVQGALAAGIRPEEVVISADGAISLRFDREGGRYGRDEVAEELDRHFGRRRA